MDQITIECIIVLLLFLICCLFSISKNNNSNRENSLIGKDVSTILKAFCCIFIVLHHYSLRYTDFALFPFFRDIGGFFSLTCFMVLSAYGITKAEMYKPTNISSFVKKRFLKIMIPLWVSTLLAGIAYYFIGASDLSEDFTADGRLNKYFQIIGEHNLTIRNCIELFFCVDLIDGVLWYVQVTILSYLTFLLSKTIFSVVRKKLKCFFLYVSIIVSLYVLFKKADIAPMYYMNLWGLILGTGMALYEKQLVKYKYKAYLYLIVLSNIYLFPFLVSERYLAHFESANLALLVIFGLNEVFKKYSVRAHSTLVLLSSLSYMIYLLHIKVLSIEWYYFGWISVLCPLILIVIVAYPLQSICSAISGKFDKIFLK